MFSTKWRVGWVSLLLLAGLIVLYNIIYWPSTPMTVNGAERLYGRNLHVGESRDDVERWLRSQKIPRGEIFQLGRLEYVIQQPTKTEGQWMDGIGGQSVAERAGLDGKHISSYIRVTYPEANSNFLSRTRIYVYLFFDSDDSLVKHWVEEFHIGL